MKQTCDCLPGFPLWLLLVLVMAPCSSANLSLSSEGVPEMIHRCLGENIHQVRLSSAIKPFYLRGDFDGDQAADHAVLVERDGLRGIAFCLSSRSRPVILGAGEEFEGHVSLDFFDAWLVRERGPVERGVEAGEPPILEGEAILVIRTEAASGIVCWDGERFSWYQQGD